MGAVGIDFSLSTPMWSGRLLNGPCFPICSARGQDIPAVGRAGKRRPRFREHSTPHTTRHQGARRAQYARTVVAWSPAATRNDRPSLCRAPPDVVLLVMCDRGRDQVARTSALCYRRDRLRPLRRHLDYQLRRAWDNASNLSRTAITRKGPMLTTPRVTGDTLATRTRTPPARPASLIRSTTRRAAPLAALAAASTRLRFHVKYRPRCGFAARVFFAPSRLEASKPHPSSTMRGPEAVWEPVDVADPAAGPVLAQLPPASLIDV